MVDTNRGFAVLALLSARWLLALGCPLSLSQSKEPMAVPTRPRHGLGDLGETAIGLAVPGETLTEDHHALQLPLPLANQERAGFQSDPFPRLRIAPVERSASAPFAFALKHVPRRLIDVAEGGCLEAVAQHPQEQPSRQMGRCLAAQVIAPLPMQTLDAEAFKIGQDPRQGGVERRQGI